MILFVLGFFDSVFDRLAFGDDHNFVLWLILWFVSDNVLHDILAHGDEVWLPLTSLSVAHGVLNAIGRSLSARVEFWFPLGRLD